MERPAVAVAYSGGRDSSALLHATLGAAEVLGIEVLALHVHHGLSSHADAWLAHCEAQCARWTRRGRPVRFFAEHLAAPPPARVSIEAWARDERYAALRRMALAHGTARILLAQHRRDQAETFFLQALRGAGVSGLSAMPGCIERDGILWLRPWLAWPREAIEAYVRRYRLRWIDDDSNAEPRFARNRLRLQVWPQLVAAFSDAEAALADAASHAQEAAAALAELAALDLAAVASARGLDVAAWSALSQARRSNALRAWLKAQTGHAAPASLAARLMAELPGRRNARWPLDSVELRLYRGVLQVAQLQVAQRQPAKRQTAQRQIANLRIENGSLGLPTPARETTLEVERAGTYRLPGWGGALQVTNVQQGGVAAARLSRLDLRPRSGGERFQAGPQRPQRSLKKQYQAAGIPPWQREGPLLYSEGRLIYVPGLGIDAGAAAAPREPQLSLCWVPG